MGLVAAAALAAGDTARAQDPPEPTTHQITRGDTDSELTTSLNQVWDSTGQMVAGVNAGDTIEFGPGVYEDIGRLSGYLYLDESNLTVRGARDPRLGEADGQCDPTKDTILTGSSGFVILNAENVTLEHFCFQNFDDGSTTHSNPHLIAPILISASAGGATIRRNRIDNTIGPGVTRGTADALAGVTITENEFIDIGLIATNGAGDSIQPRHSGKEPSALRFDASVAKTNLRIVDNLFEGSAWVAVSLYNVDGGTISGNTFRNMAKSAVSLSFSSDVTLDKNTYEGNNRAAWRVVRTADWMNDNKYGLSGPSTVSSTRATMESAALQTLLRSNRDEAVAMGMDGGLYDAAVAASANSVYRDPRLHAAVRVVGSPRVTISNSTFTNNHNSIAICGEVICRVDGLEAVGDAGDTGRAPAYISPQTFPSVDGGRARVASSVTVSGNQFKNSDTRTFDGPGSIGNHVVIGYHRASKTNQAPGPVVGSVTYEAVNRVSGSGVYGGAAVAPPPPPPPPVIVAPPPPIFIPPPPFKKDKVAVVDGAAKLEANKVTVDLVEGSLPENVETVEATVTKLTRSKTADAPDSGRFRIAYAAVYEVELEATLADETTEPLTELAAPATACLPIPRTVNNAVVLRHDAETEEWVKLPPADSAEEDEVCALSASISVYAVADEADHLEGLSANEINDFSVWEADYPLNASELLSAIPDADLLWVWHDETWTGYATFEGEPIPGAIDFPIANGDTLWLGDAGSGGDG